MHLFSGCGHVVTFDVLQITLIVGLSGSFDNTCIVEKKYGRKDRKIKVRKFI